MLINGIEIEYNHYDTNNLKTFEINHENLIKEIQVLEKSNEKVYIKSEKTCKLIVDFFIDLLGEEQTDKLITNRNDMKICIEMFKELFSAINNEVEDTNKSFQKYSITRVKHNSRRFT